MHQNEQMTVMDLTMTELTLTDLTTLDLSTATDDLRVGPTLTNAIRKRMSKNEN